ncbi:MULTISPECIES: UbiA family prenyltransferase [Actinomadura]|uniref:UbiA family prenyltransferase n=1 Tax=Actinomadura yumaensis TaxID=111807 RepID=A0ABW2CEM5_9ACTN|nr:UbiA family prenyltransferase [Actinomadura sp. J1-007]MWK35616.1 hypothetical protein [Actinomadura sp. J1-007]
MGADEPLAVRAKAWVMLAKAQSTGSYALPVLVGLSWLPVARCSADGIVMTLLGAGGVFIATSVLDDVQGRRDGSDAANYRQPGYQRSLANKPLLSDVIMLRRAWGFAVTAWLWGALSWCVLIARAPARPTAVLALVAGLVIVVPHYSWGLRLSYRGYGEVVMMYFAASLVIAAPLLAGARPTGHLVMQAVLVGAWYVTLNSYLNTVDMSGDRTAGRRTLAVRLGPSGNRRYLALLAIGDLTLTFGVIATDRDPGWDATVIATGLALRLWLAYRFQRTSDARGAGKRYWPLFHVGCLSLILTNTCS